MDIVDSLREIANGKRAGVKVMPFAATIHDAADEIERLREIIDKQMVKEFADRWANHILYDQPKIPQGFPSLLDALKEKK